MCECVRARVALVKRNMTTYRVIVQTAGNPDQFRAQQRVAYIRYLCLQKTLLYSCKCIAYIYQYLLQDVLSAYWLCGRWTLVLTHMLNGKRSFHNFTLI